MDLFGRRSLRVRGSQMRMWRRVGLATGLLLSGLTARPETSGGPWTVKPEWVRAHEEFLASDVMAGRGSATRDEQIAATYVASEFMQYGLMPAPGMDGYLQSAEVTAAEVDGRASLSVGELTFAEGKELRPLISGGSSASGPMVKLAVGDAPPADVARGSVLVFGGSFDAMRSGELMRGARKAGAVAVIVTDGDGARRLTGQWGGGTRTPMRLVETQRPAPLSLAAVSPEAMRRLLERRAGEQVTLALHPRADQARRFTFNAVGYLPGSDPAAGTLLLSAHLDHLGIGKPVKGDAIYNGANDDAAGTTAVMELAHALGSGPKLRRSVLFVCYGSEEAGELGSEYFGRHAPVALKDLVANLEFEMIGTQDPKMPKATLLLTGWERSNLGPALRDHGARLGPDPYPEQHFFERSDNYQLALEGVVAHTAAGYGTPATYHQPNDDLAHLDLAFMTAAIQSLVEPVRWLAESDFRPAWNANGQPKR